MNTPPPSRNSVLHKVAVAAAFLAFCSAVPAHAKENDFSNVVAFLGADQEKLAWEVDAGLLQALGQLDDIDPLDAKILSNALVSAVLRGNKGDKKKCCYEKVADGIWSCCDGTFVTTGAKSIGKLFDLARKSSEKNNGPEDLSEKFRPFLRRFDDPNVFKSLRGDDPQVRDIPWERMKTTRQLDSR
jgi:hypothetical protein